MWAGRFRNWRVYGSSNSSIAWINGEDMAEEGRHGTPTGSCSTLAAHGLSPGLWACISLLPSGPLGPGAGPPPVRPCSWPPSIQPLCPAALLPSCPHRPGTGLTVARGDFGFSGCETGDLAADGQYPASLGHP
uniref:Uncharacterized protein n=1 Tax=Molossus molossus TaxID=27622 RepID=A0A7J8DU32_MOLMO|nr:hypothetical protein HJG59_009100 [Molossus molossus]